MVDRLGRAIASDEIRDKMDVEDEIDRIFHREITKVANEKDKIIAAKDHELVLKNQKLVLKDQELVLKDQELEKEKKKVEEDKLKIAALLRQLEEMQKKINK
jgi:hypothetical protein